MGVYFLYAILITASIWDWRTFLIPNALSLFGVVCGLSVSFIEGGWSGLGQAAFQSLFAFAVLYALWAVFNMLNTPLIGAGDIKLYAVISTFIGFYNTMTAVYLSVLLGAAFFLFSTPPAKIKGMFDHFVYFFFYSVPIKEEKNLKRLAFSFPILIAVFLQMQLLA